MKPKQEQVIHSLHNALRESYRTNKTTDYRLGLVEFARVTLCTAKANKYEINRKLMHCLADCVRLYSRSAEDAAMEIDNAANALVM